MIVGLIVAAIWVLFLAACVIYGREYFNNPEQGR